MQYLNIHIRPYSRTSDKIYVPKDFFVKCLRYDERFFEEYRRKKLNKFQTVSDDEIIDQFSKNTSEWFGELMVGRYASYKILGEMEINALLSDSVLSLLDLALVWADYPIIREFIAGRLREYKFEADEKDLQAVESIDILRRKRSMYLKRLYTGSKTKKEGA